MEQRKSLEYARVLDLAPDLVSLVLETRGEHDELDVQVARCLWLTVLGHVIQKMPSASLDVDVRQQLACHLDE